MKSITILSLIAATGLVASANNHNDSDAVALYTGIDTSYYEDGDLWSVASYKRGRLDGVYRMWYDSGDKWFEANYKEGVPFNTLTEYYHDGNKKMEMVRIGNKEKTTSWYENGNKSYALEFSNGQPHKQHLYWYPNGNLRQENEFKDGKRVGMWTTYSSSGVPERREKFENDRLVLEENYHGGVLHGAYTAWYPNGYERVSGIYINNVKHGTWSYYNPAGQKIREEVYRTGELLEAKDF